VLGDIQAPHLTATKAFNRSRNQPSSVESLQCLSTHADTSIGKMGAIFSKKSSSKAVAQEQPSSISVPPGVVTKTKALTPIAVPSIQFDGHVVVDNAAPDAVYSRADTKSPSSVSIESVTSSNTNCSPPLRRKSDSTNDEINEHITPKKRRTSESPASSVKPEPVINSTKERNPRRRSRRGNNESSLRELARIILSNEPVVIITGAGLSAASGIRPYRGVNGLWSEVIWKQSTREEFRKNPLQWYNSFWLKYFPPHTYGEFYEPNEGHEVIAKLASLPNTNVKVITQNMDGLHSMTRHSWDHASRLIEAHGRLGLYKCIGESDSDTDSDSDEEDERKVKIGSRRKSRAIRAAYKRRFSDEGIVNEANELNKPERRGRLLCKYEFEESIPARLVEPPHISNILSGVYEEDAIINKPSLVESSIASADQPPLEASSSTESDQTREKPEIDPTVPIIISEPPLCPSCHRPCPPQALQFDEGYHSHGHYQFEKMERWIENASLVIFVGTSFAVSLTDRVLEHARQEGKLVYNFNLDGGVLESNAWLNVENVVGDVQRTLPELMRACEERIMP